MVKALVIINNNISAMMARCALEKDSIELSQVTLLLMRDIQEDWFEECFQVVKSPHKAGPLISQGLKLSVYFFRCYLMIRRYLSQYKIQHIYLVNNDNLLTNYILNRLDSKVEISVLVEGLMNFQDITIENRHRMSVPLKRIAAFMMGFRYMVPDGHLSGAYMPSVSRVFSFSSAALKAPVEKVIECQIESNIIPAGSKDSLLLILSGLYKWMSPANYRQLCTKFQKYLQANQFKTIKVKPHPRCVDDPLLNYLPDGCVMLSKEEPLEKMVNELDVGVAVGFCSTAIVTLHLMSSGVKCLDFGADFYCEHAYNGDKSVVKFFDAMGIGSVDFHDV